MLYNSLYFVVLCFLSHVFMVVCYTSDSVPVVLTYHCSRLLISFGSLVTQGRTPRGALLEDIKMVFVYAVQSFNADEIF